MLEPRQQRRRRKPGLCGVASLAQDTIKSLEPIRTIKYEKHVARTRTVKLDIAAALFHKEQDEKSLNLV